MEYSTSFQLCLKFNRCSIKTDGLALLKTENAVTSTTKKNLPQTKRLHAARKTENALRTETAEIVFSQHRSEAGFRSNCTKGKLLKKSYKRN